MVAVAIAKERTPAELRRLPVGSATGGLAPACWRWPTLWTGCAARWRPGSPAWTGRPCATGCTATTWKGVEGLRDRPRPGRPCALDEGRQAALKALVLRGPKLERDGCVAWRARDLCALVERRFGVRYGESGMLRLLKGLDLSWQKTRPVHPEADPKAQERFKKPCPA